eukprot:2904075-Rhodomonas_salina.1
MSSKVKGLPRSLSFHSALRFPCGCCAEAKAKRQPYLPASETQSRHEDDLMTWDMFDMGEKHLFLSAGLQSHCFTLIRAFARAGFTPKRVRHDGAGEYISGELEKWLEQQGCIIFTEQSNLHEQHQDGLS